MPERLRVLTISDIYPYPSRPSFGIFVARATHHLTQYCDQTVVVPYRVFPPARIFRQLPRLGRVVESCREWVREVRAVPREMDLEGISVTFARYTAPPRQILHGAWGHFAYALMSSMLIGLHRRERFDLIHAHYAVPAGVVALLAARRMEIPVVVSVHGADVTFTGRQNVIGRAVVRWVLGSADAVIANSTWTRDQVLAIGGVRERVRIVRLGADPPQAIQSQPEKAIGDRVNLLTVGYLDERKGHRYVFEAVRDLIDEGYPLNYVIVGDGPKRQELQELASQLGLAGRVFFEGTKAPDEVWPYFAECDVFVMPSWKEAFGLVYIEALSLGKPVVGCRGEGGPEDLRALGDCIQLVEPRDARSLSAGLRELLRDPKKRREMGSIGRGIVGQHFTWALNATGTLDVYLQVTGRKS